MTTVARTLSTAEERREAVLTAARRVFAEKGFYGTPTLEIAKQAGISQAYLFRLFPTKTELFLALVKRCHERIERTFVDAAAAARARGDDDVLHAMGHAYDELIADRDTLLVQMHAHAAAVHPEIGDAVRRGFARLVEVVERESGANPEDVRRFFATGMLCNVLSAMGAFQLDEPWAATLRPPASAQA